MMIRMSRRHMLANGIAAAILPTAPALLRGAPALRWRCVTSWTKGQIGPGVSAQRLAERINRMSEGALRIDVFAAGEIVPALQTFDAVSAATVEMAHTAALFWRGKMPLAPLFTTLPFGLGPEEHARWIAAEGQGFWDRLYAPFHVKPLLAGNTGPSSGGWFRKPVREAADLNGLRIRATGLGGEVYAALGALPIVTAPGDTYIALERGTIDAAEFLAPAQDLPLGMHKIARYLAWPGFNKPNGASEALIHLKAYEALSDDLRAVIAKACAEEHVQSLAEANAANHHALRHVINEGAEIFTFPPPLLEQARAATARLIDQIAQTNPLAAEAITSYRRFQE